MVRPIYGVELFDGETARFEVEISEDDVHGQWKLNGDVLSPSPVSVSVDPCDFCVLWLVFPFLTVIMLCRMWTSLKREASTR